MAARQHRLLPTSGRRLRDGHVADQITTCALITSRSARRLDDVHLTTSLPLPVGHSPALPPIRPDDDDDLSRPLVCNLNSPMDRFNSSHPETNIIIIIVIIVKHL